MQERQGSIMRTPRRKQPNLSRVQGRTDPAKLLLSMHREGEFADLEFAPEQFLDRKHLLLYGLACVRDVLPLYTAIYPEDAILPRILLTIEQNAQQEDIVAADAQLAALRKETGRLWSELRLVEWRDPATGVDLHAPATGVANAVHSLTFKSIVAATRTVLNILSGYQRNEKKRADAIVRERQHLVDAINNNLAEAEANAHYYGYPPLVGEKRDVLWATLRRERVRIMIASVPHKLVTGDAVEDRLNEALSDLQEVTEAARYTYSDKDPYKLTPPPTASSTPFEAAVFWNHSPIKFAEALQNAQGGRVGALAARNKKARNRSKASTHLKSWQQPSIGKMRADEARSPVSNWPIDWATEAQALGTSEKQLRQDFEDAANETNEVTWDNPERLAQLTKDYVTQIAVRFPRAKHPENTSAVQVIRRALADNPSMTSGDLLALFPFCPDQVRQNAVWTLLLLEEPRLEITHRLMHTLPPAEFVMHMQAEEAKMKAGTSQGDSAGRRIRAKKVINAYRVRRSSVGKLSADAAVSPLTQAPIDWAAESKFLGLPAATLRKDFEDASDETDELANNAARLASLTKDYMVHTTQRFPRGTRIDNSAAVLAIREALAQNPSMGFEDLLALYPYYPEYVRNNPALILLGLEDPEIETRRRCLEEPIWNLWKQASNLYRKEGSSIPVLSSLAFAKTVSEFLSAGYTLKEVQGLADIPTMRWYMASGTRSDRDALLTALRRYTAWVESWGYRPPYTREVTAYLVVFKAELKGLVASGTFSKSNSFTLDRIKGANTNSPKGEQIILWPSEADANLSLERRVATDSRRRRDALVLVQVTVSLLDLQPVLRGGSADIFEEGWGYKIQLAALREDTLPFSAQVTSAGSELEKALQEVQAPKVKSKPVSPSQVTPLSQLAPIPFGSKYKSSRGMTEDLHAIRKDIAEALTKGELPPGLKVNVNRHGIEITAMPTGWRMYSLEAFLRYPDNQRSRLWRSRDDNYTLLIKRLEEIAHAYDHSYGETGDYGTSHHLYINAKASYELEKESVVRLVKDMIAVLHDPEPVHKWWANDIIEFVDTSQDRFDLGEPALKLLREAIAERPAKLAQNAKQIAVLTAQLEKEYEKPAAKAPPAPESPTTKGERARVIAAAIERREAAKTPPPPAPPAPISDEVFLPSAARSMPMLSKDDIPYDLATRSHSGTSHDPGLRGTQEQQEYLRFMTAVWGNCEARATTPEEAQIAYTEFERYRQNWIGKKKALLSAHSRIMSTMITGPARFPVARMAKINDSYQRKVEEFLAWDKRAQQAMQEAIHPTDTGVISSTDPSAVAKIEAKIAQLKQLQEFMRSVNNQLRLRTINDSEKIRNIKEMADSINLPITEAAILRRMKPSDNMGQMGYLPFELTNNNAEIHRLEARLPQIKRMLATPERSATFAGGSIEEDKKQGKIFVYHDDKPSEEVRSKMKGIGLHYTPSQPGKPWGRKLSPNAVAAVERIFGVKLTTAAPLESVAEETPIVEASIIEEASPEPATKKSSKKLVVNKPAGGWPTPAPSRHHDVPSPQLTVVEILFPEVIQGDSGPERKAAADLVVQLHFHHLSAAEHVVQAEYHDRMSGEWEAKLLTDKHHRRYVSKDPQQQVEKDHRDYHSCMAGAHRRAAALYEEAAKPVNAADPQAYRPHLGVRLGPALSDAFFKDIQERNAARDLHGAKEIETSLKRSNRIRVQVTELAKQLASKHATVDELTAAMHELHARALAAYPNGDGFTAVELAYRQAAELTTNESNYQKAPAGDLQRTFEQVINKHPNAYSVFQQAERGHIEPLMALGVLYATVPQMTVKDHRKAAAWHMTQAEQGDMRLQEIGVAFEAGQIDNHARINKESAARMLAYGHRAWAAGHELAAATLDLGDDALIARNNPYTLPKKTFLFLSKADKDELAREEKNEEQVRNGIEDAVRMLDLMPEPNLQEKIWALSRKAQGKPRKENPGYWRGVYLYTQAQDRILEDAEGQTEAAFLAHAPRRSAYLPPPTIPKQDAEAPAPRPTPKLRKPMKKVIPLSKKKGGPPKVGTCVQIWPCQDKACTVLVASNGTVYWAGWPCPSGKEPEASKVLDMYLKRPQLFLKTDASKWRN